MFYRDKLSFLTDTLKKCHIRSLIGTAEELASVASDMELSPFFDYIRAGGQTIPEFLDTVEAHTVYQLNNALGPCFRYLLLPDLPLPTVLLIGPYLTRPQSAEQLLELYEGKGLSPKKLRLLAEFYASIPTLAEGNPLFSMLDTFCEHVWRSPSFSIVDIDRDLSLPVSPINFTSHQNDFEDILVNMQTMEKRYAFENELMQAVCLGQLHKEKLLLAAMDAPSFERRLSDPLRNAKNYDIIMNTLLRKAAEQGGVHPVYLDRMSSSFASRIEQLHSTAENTSLMREMFRAYCRLVRKHALKDFSPVVQKTILMIDSDLSADLTLHSLARSQGVSAGYLSTIFKKETGENVSRYIQEKRIRHATHLLDTTNLQIQTVALHCGILDVQYFSKIFKQRMGVTPKEYRRRSKSRPE